MADIKSEKHKCPVCGQYEFPFDNSFFICPVCGWMDDGVQEEEPDYDGGANIYSLNQCRKMWKEEQAQK